MTLDKRRMQVTAGGTPIDLTPTEFELLATLARQPGRVFTRAQLLDAVRGDAVESFERAIDAHVKNLRRKLGTGSAKPALCADGARRRLQVRRLMRRPSCGPGKPPWWPDNEPWPPAEGQRRMGRARFFRRLAWLVLAMLVLGVCGTLALAWLAAIALGAVPAGQHALAPILLIGGLSGALVAVALLAGIVRRVGMPLGPVMGAAERVASGDYTVAIAERGPPPLRALARAFNTMTNACTATTASAAT